MGPINAKGQGFLADLCRLLYVKYRATQEKPAFRSRACLWVFSDSIAFHGTFPIPDFGEGWPLNSKHLLLTLGLRRGWSLPPYGFLHITLVAHEIKF